MKFCVIYQQSTHNAQSPVRVVEQTTGRGVGWINRYLDREYVRRLANTTLRICAYNLLHFVRWWESVHPTGDIREGDLTESTLLDYVRFQSSQQPRPSPSTINDRVAVAERAIRNEFPDAPCQIARGFHQAFLRRRPMGLGRRRVAMSRLRVKVPKRNIVPLSVNEVSRFWSKANGPAIIDTLKNQLADIIAITPQGSKEARAQAAAPEPEAGNYHLPNNAMGDAVVEECASFPNGSHDDQVDTWSQAAARFRGSYSGVVDYYREAAMLVGEKKAAEKPAELVN
jgi:predicted phage terminase large subunit-like protein